MNMSMSVTMGVEGFIGDDADESGVDSLPGWITSFQLAEVLGIGRKRMGELVGLYYSEGFGAPSAYIDVQGKEVCYELGPKTSVAIVDWYASAMKDIWHRELKRKIDSVNNVPA
ncbi:hypothetical protein [Pseudomonas sp. TE3610]